jgi:hypothetical protein
MLPIPVELKGNVVLATVGKDETGLDGSADTKVDREVNDPGTVCPGDDGCCIRGAVVDDDDIALWKVLSQVMQDSRQ